MKDPEVTTDVATPEAPGPRPATAAEPKKAKLPWYVKDREAIPTDPRKAHQWIREIVEGHKPGEQFFHPGLGRNAQRVPYSSDPMGAIPTTDTPGDLDAWIEGGCIGTAPDLKR